MKVLRTFVWLLFLLILTSCADDRFLDEGLFKAARANGALANEGFRRCLDFTYAWLEQADSATGLIPENLYHGNDTWNAHNSAADNYPFMVLTALLLDQPLFKGTMYNMLQSERNLTSRVNSLPDDYSLNNQDFVR